VGLVGKTEGLRKVHEGSAQAFSLHGTLAPGGILLLASDGCWTPLGLPALKRAILSGVGKTVERAADPQHMKNSLNFANTCLKVVDTRRASVSLWT